MKRFKKYFNGFFITYDCLAIIKSIWNLIDKKKELIINILTDIMDNSTIIMLIIAVIGTTKMLIWINVNKKKKSKRQSSNIEKLVNILDTTTYKG